MTLFVWFLCMAVGGYAVTSFGYMSIDPNDWSMLARYSVGGFPVIILAICSYVEIVTTPVKPSFTSVQDSLK